MRRMIVAGLLVLAACGGGGVAVTTLPLSTTTTTAATTTTTRATTTTVDKVEVFGWFAVASKFTGDIAEILKKPGLSSDPDGLRNLATTARRGANGLGNTTIPKAIEAEGKGLILGMRNVADSADNVAACQTTSGCTDALNLLSTVLTSYSEAISRLSKKVDSL